VLLGSLNKILVPLDLSPASLEGLREAVDIAGESGATLVLLTVIDTRFPFPELYSFEDPDHDFFRSMRETALARMQSALEELPEVPAERLVVRGRPRTEIAAMARELGVDLVVLTTHGSGGFRESLLGGTAEAVVRQAPCPVLVLPVSKDHASPLPGA
jgi:nucleotide-binding universal stress UspA family protein